MVHVPARRYVRVGCAKIGRQVGIALEVHFYGPGLAAEVEREDPAADAEGFRGLVEGEVARRPRQAEAYFPHFRARHGGRLRFISAREDALDRCELLGAERT